MKYKYLKQNLTSQELDKYLTNMFESLFSQYKGNVKSSFCGSFVFKKTPEGHKYWMDILKRVERGRGVKKFSKKDKIFKTIFDIDNNNIVDYRSIAIDIISKVETEIREQGMDSGFNESQMDEMYNNLSTKVLPYIKNEYDMDDSQIESCEAEMQFTLEEGGKIEFIIEYCGNILGYFIEDIRFVFD